ncbi:DNA-binding MarR family transcriptional regulator [Sinorhizobium kostiense]|uniref:DNA-binding MarR family transcriptional regulator n=1 Tax=Sinorhizobium kostiense TaxID=76747 RepID=A0ABS4QZ65_9HYPH|nr:MarR family winged helix-turn-helix transcriptional regulator [Sinorhizobium kostiense]MBP2235938.1 DNA-binding MarR family transcriptional regulator [Sinorhizobium kostiense]
MAKASLQNGAPAPAITQAWIGLMRAQQRVLAAIEKDFKSAGLPPLGWYDVLWELVKADGGRLRPFEIEARTLLTQYNLSRLIDRLEREGLVRREAFDADGRGRWIVVTEEGRAVRERMWRTYARSIERHVGGKLSEAEARDLAALLSRL